MTVDDVFDDDPTEGGLIRNGRYQIWYPDQRKPVARTRITNYARTLEDTFGLMSWQQRMVAVGLTHREDLRIQVAACDPDIPADRAALNRLCEQAKDAARANARRDTGSALHRLAERVDRGETFPIPAPWDADIAAYQAALADAGIGIVADYIEGVVVTTSPDLAGRFDRIVRYHDRLVIGDLKTGQDLSYSWGSIAIQLALYANATSLYDPATKTHMPMPDIDKTVGLVFHLPAESGTCQIFEVDLKEGVFGAILVGDVHGYRKNAANIATVLSPAPILAVVDTSNEGVSEPSPVAHPQEEPGGVGTDGPAPPELRVYVQARIQAIKDFGVAGRLAKSWPEDVPTLKASGDHTEDQLDAILAACTRVEAEAEMPFPAFDDPRTLRPAPEPPPPPPDPPVDVEGPKAPETKVAAARVAFAALEPDARAAIGAIVVQAEDAGFGLAVKACPSWRRLHIARALMALAIGDDLEALARTFLAPIVGELEGSVTTGAYLGALTGDEAKRFAALVAATTDLVETTNQNKEQ